jgi:hypothetical protein
MVTYLQVKTSLLPHVEELLLKLLISVMSMPRARRRQIHTTRQNILGDIPRNLLQTVQTILAM